MFKHCLLLLLVVSTLFSVGCGQTQEFSELSTPAITVSSTPSSTPEPPKPVLFQNPLTGVRELEEQGYNRPVAVMVNNFDSAQGVQAGLNDAGLVYECFIEGGITRLMAVYYDLSKVGQIGTIRSARKTFVELAQGLGAQYCHHGIDNVYTKPYIREIGLDNYQVGYTSGDSFRDKDNGLAWEHTLYTTGESLTKGLETKKHRLTNTEPTQSAFTFGETPTTPATPCQSISYVMSSEYKTTFEYDQNTGKYTRCPMGTPQNDLITGKPVQFTNVFILYASTSSFPDNYHVYTTFSSGKGLYVSQGGYQEITWEKGDATDPLVVKTADGQTLTVNPGNSFIAFPPKYNEKYTTVTPAAQSPEATSSVAE